MVLSKILLIHLIGLLLYLVPLCQTTLTEIFPCADGSSCGLGIACDVREIHESELDSHHLPPAEGCPAPKGIPTPIPEQTETCSDKNL